MKRNTWKAWAVGAVVAVVVAGAVVWAVQKGQNGEEGRAEQKPGAAEAETSESNINPQEAGYRALGLTTPELRKRFEEKVAARKGPTFDPELKLLYVARPTLKTYANLPPDVPAHVTRDTLYLACSILKGDDAALYPAAEVILANLLTMQDTEPSSPTYGTWPRAYELPLATDVKPDLNWTAFFGEALLDLRLSHPERLPDDLRKSVDRAIDVAARATLARTGRHADPGYTNIAVKGAALACLAGQISGDPELQKRAMKKLRGIAAYTERHGDFTEYNSPTYEWVTIGALQVLRQHATDPETKEIAQKLYHLAWEGVALHYHEPSGQWTGPYSRTYFDLLGPANEFAQTLPKALQAPSDELSVPEDLVRYFSPESLPRTVIRSYHRPDAERKSVVVNGELLGILPLAGTTHLTPEYALGSISAGDFWWQKRAVMAHWGTRKNPGYFRLRFLSDGKDFQAPVIVSVQAEGRVLSAISFPTDGARYNYDRMPGGKLKTSSLRLRFEFGGAGREAVLPIPERTGEMMQIDLGAIRMNLQVPFAAWGDSTVRYKTGGDDRASWIDLILHDGEPVEVDFNKLKSALIVIALEIFKSTSEASAPQAPVVEVQGGEVEVAWSGLFLRAPLTPDGKEALLRRYRPGPAAESGAVNGQ